MYKYILFDLDGTLLPLDIDVFVQKYFEAVTPFFKDFVEPEVFFKKPDIFHGSHDKQSWRPNK